MVINKGDGIEDLAEEIEMRVSGAVRFLLERKNHEYEKDNRKYSVLQLKALKSEGKLIYL
jgi:hypothetical protein